MRKFILITSIAIASMAAAPAATAKDNADQAKASAQAAPDQNATAPAADEKKICKLLPSSYSHHSDRVCLTKQDWAKVDEESRG